MSESNIWHVSTICLPFSNWLITSILSSIFIVFPRFFTWITLGHVDLRFSLILVANANAAEGGTVSAALLHYRHNQFIHVTDSLTMTPLSASPQHKTSAAKGRLCQIALN